MAPPVSGTSRPQPTQSEPAGGVGAPPDDGGHVGSYTVPSDVMNQEPSERRDQLNEARTAKPVPGARFPLLGIVVLLLVLLFVAWLTWRAGL